jgi:predicted enzyme related to lactoylglutathione lyase
LRRASEKAERLSILSRQHVAVVDHVNRTAVTGVMLFVAKPRDVAVWYAEAFRAGPSAVVEEAGGLCHFDYLGIELAFHPADAQKNPPGASTVVYWASHGVIADRQRLVELGARHHRGPLEVSDSRWICQLADPVGNIFGLDGPP